MLLAVTRENAEEEQDFYFDELSSAFQSSLSLKGKTQKEMPAADADSQKHVESTTIGNEHCKQEEHQTGLNGSKIPILKKGDSQLTFINEGKL